MLIKKRNNIINIEKDDDLTVNINLIRQQDLSRMSVKSRFLSNDDSSLNHKKREQESSYSAHSKSQILSLVLKSSGMWV